MSSDTSSRFLLEEKIKIDMILSIDSGNGTLYHIQENSEKIPYLTWLGANSYIFEVKNPKYIYFSTFPIDQLIQEIFFPNLPCLENPSLNIAGIAKSFSQSYQFSSFKLLGVDFKSFYGKTHCKGTGYEIFHLPIIHRKKGLESHLKMNLEHKMAKKLLLSQKKFSNTTASNIKNHFINKTIFKMDMNVLKKSLDSLEFQNFLQEELGEKLKLNKYLKILS